MTAVILAVGCALALAAIIAAAIGLDGWAHRDRPRR